MENNTVKFELGPVQKAWIKSLRENPERQMTGTLGRKPYGSESYTACCLGEGGLIAGVCEWRDKLSENGDFFVLVVKNTVHVSTGILDYDAYQALGLYNYQGIEKEGFLLCEQYDANKIDRPVFTSKIGLYTSLSALNDRGNTWLEIADELENNPERWFKESK